MNFCAIRGSLNDAALVSAGFAFNDAVIEFECAMVEAVAIAKNSWRCCR